MGVSVFGGSPPCSFGFFSTSKRGKNARLPALWSQGMSWSGLEKEGAGMQPMTSFEGHPQNRGLSSNTSWWLGVWEGGREPQ